MIEIRYYVGAIRRHNGPNREKSEKLYADQQKLIAKLMEPEKFSEWRWVPIKDYIAEESYSGFNPPAQKMITDYLVNLK